MPLTVLNEWDGALGVTGSGASLQWADPVGGKILAYGGGVFPTSSGGFVNTNAGNMQTSVNYAPQAQPLVVAWRGKYTWSSGNARVIGWNKNSADLRLEIQSPGSLYSVYAGVFGLAPTVSYTSQVVTNIIMEYNGVASKLYQNGVQVGLAGDAGLNGIPALKFFIGDSGIDFSWHRIRVCTGVPDAADIAALNDWLTNGLVIPPVVGAGIFTLADANMGIGVSLNQPWRSGAPITGDGILLPRTIGQPLGTDNFGNNTAARQARLLQATANTPAGTDVLPGWFTYINVVAGEWVWCISRTNVAGNADSPIGAPAPGEVLFLV